jgi:predicted ATP-grasp superfamily ATP-dependent carboligase
MGIFMLVWNGTVRAHFAHRRLREKPPSGGVSVYCESVAPDPAIVNASAQLLAKLNWLGVAMLEYKVERRTGIPYLMEVNPRFWGSLQLAIDAGVDFPRLLVDLAAGRTIGPAPQFRVGIRSRWWWGDVDQLLLRLRRTAAELSLPNDADSRAEAVMRFLTWGQRDRNEVLRFDDPRPFLRETALWFSRR